MMKAYSYREFRRILERNGFSWDRTTGSHETFVKGDESVTITTKKISAMICRRLIKEHGLEV